MAKKGQRQLVGLVCSNCKSHNYTTEKNKTNSPEKLALRRYCRSCRKHTIHRETAKLD